MYNYNFGIGFREFYINHILLESLLVRRLIILILAKSSLSELDATCTICSVLKRNLTLL
jgi:hypothetical protein